MKSVIDRGTSRRHFLSDILCETTEGMQEGLLAKDSFTTQDDVKTGRFLLKTVPPTTDLRGGLFVSWEGLLKETDEEAGSRFSSRVSPSFQFPFVHFLSRTDTFERTFFVLWEEAGRSSFSHTKWSLTQEREGRRTSSWSIWSLLWESTWH